MPRLKYDFFHNYIILYYIILYYISGEEPAPSPSPRPNPRGAWPFNSAAVLTARNDYYCLFIVISQEESRQ